MTAAVTPASVLRAFELIVTPFGSATAPCGRWVDPRRPTAPRLWAGSGPPKSTFSPPRHSGSGTHRSVAAALALGLALLVAYVALFTAAFRDPQPKGLEVAVFAPGGMERQLEQGLERSAPGIYQLDRVGSARTAREAVLDRTADGGVVVTADGARVLTAEAGGLATAQALAVGL